MAEAVTTVAVSVLAKLSEYSVKPVLRQLRPIFCFQSIVDDFKSATTELKNKQETVESEVRQATNNAGVALAGVEDWLASVSKMMLVVNGLETQLRANHSSRCHNWTCNYKFSRLLLKTTKKMMRLCDDGNFRSVARPASPLHQHIVGSSSSKAFVHSRSSKPAFEQIMEALENDGVNIVGLYGETGMGKTMLAEKVAEEAINDSRKRFDPVIRVNVAKNELRSIQGKIADYLNMKLEQEDEEGRASRLKQRLERGEKILLILDDVWKEFDFGAVGIPSPNSGCKVLLTARSKSDVPDCLQIQRYVQLGFLPEDEAWDLVQSIAGISDEVRAHVGAKNAIAECRGRPKFIMTLGRALRGKSLSEWDEALEQLHVSKQKVTEDLEEQAKNLSRRRERVETEIKKAKDNAEEIHKDVDNWLTEVDKVMNDKEQFMNEFNQRRYLFDEHDDKTKAKELTVIVNKLWAEGDFSKVSYSSPLRQLLGSSDFMPSQSAISAFNQILEALQKDDVYIIGLYGMGGIGKTTLAKQVQKEVQRIKIFDHAVMVTLSQNPKSLSVIQEEIAEKLNMKLEEKTEEVRASKLNQRFKDGKILVILDDIWKRFDLKTIGIELNGCKGCKILLTSRSKKVCVSMDCETSVKLDLLSDDEALEFFTKKACLSKELKLNVLIEEIVRECKGLPIALATVGAALRNTGEDEWREALEKLGSSRLVDIDGVDNDDINAYKCLKVSYDYLTHSAEAQEKQFILLLCSLCPEDRSIQVEALSRYAFGMRLFHRVKSIEDARRKVRVIIRSLKESCLLLDAVDGDVVDEDYVKVHDVVRDAMLWIGGTESREKKVLIVRDESDLKEFTRNKSFLNCRAISFMAESVPVLSKYNQLDCPHLETIIIFGGEDRVVELSNEFFQHMTFLKVFHSQTIFSWTKCTFGMPQSLCNLKDLRALMLDDCKCSNSSILGEFRNLEILSLEGSEIDCRGEIVSGLKELRLLDLSRMKAEKEYPSNMIEALPKLEELYGHVIRKCEDGEGRSSIEGTLSSNLVALSVGIEDATCIPIGFCFPNLVTYSIHVGTEYNSFFWSEASIMRRLELEGIENESAMINICKELLPTVVDLRLEKWKELCSLAVFTSHAQGLLQMLEILEIEDCYKMERVFEFEEDENISNNINTMSTQLHSLKKLSLSCLAELKHVWKGPTRSVSLSNLTQLDISYCSKLTCVFPSPLLATTLQQLEMLRIKSCAGLEEVISRGGDRKEERIICFQKLKTLEVSECGKLKTIFPISVAFPKLKRLQLKDNAELEHVLFGQLDWDCTCQYPLLKELSLKGCPKLRLKNVWKGPTSNNINTIVQLHFLKELTLYDLTQLKHVWKGPTSSVTLSNLTQINIWGCSKLTCVFPSPLLATTLQQLEMLNIIDCDDLEEIISWRGDSDLDNIQGVKAADGKEEPVICFQKLKTLQVRRCGKLKTIFPISVAFPKLKRLQLKHNAELEHVLLGQSDWEYPLLEHNAQLSLVGCPKLCTQFVAACIKNLSTTKPVRKIVLGYIREVEKLIQLQSQNNQLDDSEDADRATLFSSLETLILWNMAELKFIWHGPTKNICFASLSEIKVIGCNKLKHIFNTTVAENLPKLKKLLVWRCNELEQVITVDGDGEEEWENSAKAEIITRVGFESLEVLHVSNCEKLKTIFSVFIPLPKLDCLRLESNANLESLFGQSDSVCTSSSTYLKTLSCDDLEEVTSRGGDSGGDDLDNIQGVKAADVLFGQSDWEYPFLKELSIVGCPKLCTQLVAACITNLSTTKAKNITLGDIQGVEDVTQIERSYLEKLSLQNLQDLKCMWRDPTQNICFVNLYRLEVIGCNRLKHLSDTTIATTLPKLTKLIIRRCCELEQVIVMAENGNELTAGLVFENLSTLNVSECGKLKIISPIIIVLPKLERLRIEKNAELEHVFGQSGKDCTWKYPFLTELCLQGCPKICTQFAVSCIQNLSTTKPVRKIELGYIRGVEKLIQLQSQNNQFDDSEDADRGTMFSSLETLILRNVAELKFIFHGPTENICFASLSEIKVIGCNKLKHIFRTAIAGNLPKLKKLIVRRCNELEQVITVDGDGKEEWENNAKVGLKTLEVLYVSNCEKLKTIFSIFIPLPKLNCLRLESNANLESLFGQSDSVYTSNSTYLKTLSVTGCPKLCKQFVDMIKSQLQPHSTSEEGRIINLSSIQGVEELVQFHRQEDGTVDETIQLPKQCLKLEEVGDLKRIWSGPTQNTSFSFLYALRVIGCSRLKHLFTTSMATSLHNLGFLSVERCYELEQIIEEEEDMNEENNTQSVQLELEFSELDILRLIDLPKLMRFCPISCNLLLPELAEKNLIVEGCPNSITDFFSQQTYKQDSDMELYEFDDAKDEDDDLDEYDLSSPKSFCKLLGLKFVEEV